MNKTITKILSVIFIIAIVVCMSSVSFADEEINPRYQYNANYNSDGTPKTNEVNGSSLAKKFSGSSSITTEGETLLEKVMTPVLSVVKIIATGISVIMITYLGIKYMAAAPSEKASIKNQLITFTIGAIVVLGTTALLDIIKNFAQSAIK